MVDLSGIRLHVQRLAPPAGRPPTATAVLLHGLLTDSLASYYFTVAPALAEAGIEVVMYDQRGHGRSDRPEAGYGLDAFVDDLDALLHRLAVPGAVHLVGNSFGGTVAFGYADRRPERVATITAIESEPATDAWAVKLDGLLERLRSEMAADEAGALDWITTHRGPHTARLARSAGRLVQATSIARDVPASPVLTDERIRALDCPVLLLYGGDSDLVAGAARLSSLLPRCHTAVLPGHEHSVLVESPEWVLDHTLDWIRAHRAAPWPAEAGVR
jgi:pimeloyl-ACP methyl ester carboxylesterase